VFVVDVDCARDCAREKIQNVLDYTAIHKLGLLYYDSVSKKQRHHLERKYHPLKMQSHSD